MLLHIDSVLTAAEAANCRAALEEAEWVDGRVTAGYQSARTKHNMQLPEDHPFARELSDRLVTLLQQNPLFMGAALYVGNDSGLTHAAAPSITLKSTR